MDPRRRKFIIVAVISALLAIVAAIAAVVHRSSDQESVGHPDVIWADPRSHGPVTPLAPEPPMTEATDPETFARLAAQTLFDWDTTKVDARASIVDELVYVGDPSGESTPGLVADVENYLPPEAAWDELQRYSTTQRLQIRAIGIPALWAEAERQAGPHGLSPGTAAFTIRGTRHRAGTWEGRAVTSEHAVAFTVFVVCAPSYPQCRLLRLSRPDTPLR